MQSWGGEGIQALVPLFYLMRGSLFRFHLSLTPSRRPFYRVSGKLRGSGPQRGLAQRVQAALDLLCCVQTELVGGLGNCPSKRVFWEYNP